MAAAAEQERLKVPTDWEALERRWRAVTDEEPVPEAWYNVGVCLERRGKLDEARQAYRRAVDLMPALAPAAVNLALLEEPADPRQAQQAWAELARRFPGDAVPRVRLAALYQGAGQLDEAWRLGREALVRDPRAVGAYDVLMRVALERRQPDLAQLLAVKAERLAPRDAALAAFRGDVLHAMKDQPGAVAQWTRAVQLQDDYLPARYALLGEALAHQRWEAVSEQARAILRSRPDDARVQLTLGVALRYLGQPDQALAAYEQAERLGAGKLPEVYLARGVALMKSKEQCEPAMAELQRYQREAGPAAVDGPAGKLLRECAQLVAESKAAEEAAREMRAEAEARKKAATPAAEAGAPAPTR